MKQVRPRGGAGEAAWETDAVRGRLAADGPVALLRLPRQLRPALHRQDHGAHHHPLRLHRHGEPLFRRDGADPLPVMPRGI